MPALAKETAIREHAYYLWEREGRPAGRDLEFWGRAAAELTTMMRRTRTPAAKPATATPAADRAEQPKAAAPKPKAAKPKTAPAKAPAKAAAPVTGAKPSRRRKAAV